MSPEQREALQWAVKVLDEVMEGDEPQATIRAMLTTPAASTPLEGKVREAREFLEIARESLEPYADPEFIRGLSQSTAESRSFLAKVGLKQIDAQLQSLAAPAPACKECGKPSASPVWGVCRDCFDKTNTKGA